MVGGTAGDFAEPQGSLMQQEDRVIHFGVELIHKPVKHKKEVLQKLYFDLSQIRGAGYDSTDFTRPMQPRFYSKRGKRSQSIAVFLPDRVLMVEEWADVSMNDFLERLEAVASRVLEIEGVAPFMAHTATIRSTFGLSNFDDARAFLLEQVCNQGGKISPHFQRPVAVGGLRFTLPETDEYPGNLQLTIESFRQSRNEVYVEAKGIFTREKVQSGEFDIVLDHIRGVRGFITDRIFPYLDQYDVAPEGVE
jgi:hypothetical protein